MTLKIVAVGLLGAMLGCAPSSSGPAPEPDPAPASGDMAMRTPASAPVDMAMAPSCGSTETFCQSGSTPCVSSWAAAQHASSWCKPGVTASIYITTTPCGAGYQGVAIVSPLASPTGHYFFYETGAVGALDSISSYEPDGEGNATCVAGPTALPSLINASGCAFANPVECADGVLQ